MDAADPVMRGHVAAIASRVRHVHARIGHAQGPQVRGGPGCTVARAREKITNSYALNQQFLQVADPRVAAEEANVAGIEGLWDIIWDAQEKLVCGRRMMTLRPWRKLNRPGRRGSRRVR
jgi:hypothetical protein